MNEETISSLIAAANKYETKAFINADPIQFPHRYTHRRDIEISAFISAWMAYGSRKVFLKVLDHLHDDMDKAGGPYSFITSGAYSCICTEPDCCLYRFYKQSDFITLCL